MNRVIAACAGAALAAGAFVMPAAAQNAAPSLSQRLAKDNAAPKLTLEVACGKLEKSNCAQVLPRIGEQSVPAGLALQPVESEGSVESATGVCVGAVPAAIVQRDAADQRRRQADCAGRFDPVGKPLYPYFGYLVVSANADYSSLSAMLEDTPNGKTRTIAAGAVGSGGQVTLAAMLRANPDWKRVVNVASYGLETALQRIQDGSADAFFVMDGPGSELIEQIRTTVDAKKKPLFKFLDVRPGRAFYAIKDWSSRPMYQEATIASGFFRDTRTVSVDAVTIVANDFRENRSKFGPRAVEILAGAIDRAQAAIWADTKTPRDWVPASARKE